LNVNVDAAQNLIYLTLGRDETVMHYRDLHVIDANQQPLPARMVQTGADRFAIVVDDQRAQYPVLVDPLVNDGYLNETGGQLFGYSVAYIDYYQQNLHTDTEVEKRPGSDASMADIGGLLVGVPHYDSGTKTNAGAVYFYNTDEGALPTTATWTNWGTQTNELLGWSVADGGANTNYSLESGPQYHNILVGAPGYAPPHSPSCGAAFAFYPNQSTGVYPSSPSWTATGAFSGEGAQFGWCVAGNVDFYGNGYSDAIVGAPNANIDDVRIQDSASPSLVTSWSGAGEVLIYKGVGGGYSNAPTWTKSGATGSGFGVSVDWGYVQGSFSDYPALIVGAPGVSSSSGAVYEFLGTAEGPDTTADLTLDGTNSGDLFGYSICSRADQNDDTYQDLLVGAPGEKWNSDAGAGMVYLYQGSSTGLGSTAAWVAGGDATNASFGASVALGDMNNDNYADVIVGEPNMSTTSLSLTQNGYVRLYLTDTVTSLPTNTAVIVGQHSYINTGASVAYGPDLANYDEDLIAGVPGGSTSTAPSVVVMKWSP
jgi:hypothetical protein